MVLPAGFPTRRARSAAAGHAPAWGFPVSRPTPVGSRADSRRIRAAGNRL